MFAPSKIAPRPNLKAAFWLVLTIVIASASTAAFADAPIVSAATKVLSLKRGSAVVAGALKNPKIASAITSLLSVSDITMVTRNPELAREALLLKLSASNDPGLHKRVAEYLGINTNPKIVQSPAPQSNPVASDLGQSSDSEVGELLDFNAGYDNRVAKNLQLEPTQITGLRTQFEHAKNSEYAAFSDLMQLTLEKNASSTAIKTIRSYFDLMSSGTQEFSISPADIQSHLTNWPNASLINFSETLADAAQRIKSGSAITRQDAFEKALDARGLLEKYRKGCAVR